MGLKKKKNGSFLPGDLKERLNMGMNSQNCLPKMPSKNNTSNNLMPRGL